MGESKIIVSIKSKIPNGRLSPEDIKVALEKHFAGEFEVKEAKAKVGGGFLQ